MSNWIWVVELQDARLSVLTRRCVLGEIAIDATSDRIEPHALVGNLPTRHYEWHGSRDPSELPVADYEPYLSDTALHDAPTAEEADVPRLDLPVAESEPVKRAVQRLRAEVGRRLPWRRPSRR